MDLRALGYFLAVYEEQSVSGAARRCHVSQPSVSEAVSSLEDTLAVRLFVRHRKGATPTAAAERLYPAARSLVDGARALPGLFAVAAPKPTLTVGLMKSLDVERTKKLLATLARQDVVLRVVDADEPCDVRIVARTMREEAEVFVPLWEERYVVAVPKSHPFAKQSTIRGTDLAGQKLVARCHCENAAHFSVSALRFDVVAIAPSEEWAVALVGAGLGIAILPEGVVPKDASGVVTRPIRDVYAKREVGIAYGRSGAPSGEVQRFVDAVRRRKRG